MDHRIFGINHQGVFNVDKKTGKVTTNYVIASTILITLIM